ncbi:hypothetical protein EDEG_00908 [Edhazardia aedis USNM 41457]|uniref:Uncharacterized protein n=1 Tax=Edhazardia aedis (strain USNM 41457) TaxID=1003232 RepID=J9DB54_EDHAE|nr:hypothetical protein EDEG_00908 [Edhazardia aedis USNM 41457]|eukprot:EJW04991.1 hypothetical protein EDEG_00908 [Edhazardia aedis USNM 41457]
MLKKNPYLRFLSLYAKSWMCTLFLLGLAVGVLYSLDYIKFYNRGILLLKEKSKPWFEGTSYEEANAIIQGHNRIDLGAYLKKDMERQNFLNSFFVSLRERMSEIDNYNSKLFKIVRFNTSSNEQTGFNCALQMLLSCTKYCLHVCNTDYDENNQAFSCKLKKFLCSLFTNNVVDDSLVETDELLTVFSENVAQLDSNTKNKIKDPSKFLILMIELLRKEECAFPEDNDPINVVRANYFKNNLINVNQSKFEKNQNTFQEVSEVIQEIYYELTLTENLNTIFVPKFLSTEIIDSKDSASSKDLHFTKVTKTFSGEYMFVHIDRGMKIDSQGRPNYFSTCVFMEPILSLENHLYVLRSVMTCTSFAEYDANNNYDVYTFSDTFTCRKISKTEVDYVERTEPFKYINTDSVMFIYERVEVVH